MSLTAVRQTSFTSIDWNSCGKLSSLANSSSTLLSYAVAQLGHFLQFYTWFWWILYGPWLPPALQRRAFFSRVPNFFFLSPNFTIRVQRESLILNGVTMCMRYKMREEPTGEPRPADLPCFTIVPDDRLHLSHMMCVLFIFSIGESLLENLYAPPLHLFQRLFRFIDLASQFRFLSITPVSVLFRMSRFDWYIGYNMLLPLASSSKRVQGASVCIRSRRRESLDRQFV